MRRWILPGAVVAAMLSSIAGCGDGMAVTSRERMERHRKIAEYDERQFNDDWDHFWLNDDISRLSMWRVR